MSDIKKSFSDLIGNTPLYAAEKFAAKAGANAQVLRQKLEYFNPAGSVKDRIANAMIDDAEASPEHSSRAQLLSSRPPATPASVWQSVAACPRLPHHPHHAGNHER